MSRVVPGMDGVRRAMASQLKWRRPRSFYPRYEALCACWRRLNVGEEVVIARNSAFEGSMTPYDAAHFRGCFRRVANRYGYYANLQYVTDVRDRDLVLTVLDLQAGYPRLSDAEGLGGFHELLRAPEGRRA